MLGRGRWARGKCDRADPEIADSGRRLLELSFSTHMNNTCNALRVAPATTSGAVEGQRSKLVGPHFWACMAQARPASATAALPAHAEHPSST